MYQLVEPDRCVRDQPPLSTQLRTSILFPALPIHLLPSTFWISKSSRLSTLVFFFPRAIVYA